MSYTYSFEKLDIWNLSMALSVKIYSTTKSFPSEEKFGITSQLRRAASSVAANIAEGSTRSTKKDKARFLQIAFGSLIETLNFLILSTELMYITKDHYHELRKSIEEISNKINAYHRKLI